MHFETVRKAASLVGADPDNLVLCSNVTSALNDVLKSIRLKPEDQGSYSDEYHREIHISDLIFLGRNSIRFPKNF